MDQRCNATIWKRDTYRRTGRTKSGFEMHYAECQCSRRPASGEFCSQHAVINLAGANITRYRKQS